MTTEPLSPQVIDKILEMGTATKLRRGQYVFREGDPGDHVYLVRRGRVKIVITTPTGRELVLAMKQAGQLVGEFAALDGRPRSASAMASESTELIVVSGPELLRALEADTTIALDMLKQLASMIRAAGERTASRISADTKTRLAQRLIELADAFGEHDEYRETVRLSLTQDDLAGWIGATREATARALGDLRSTGCVTTGRQRVEITDLAALSVAARD